MDHTGVHKVIQRTKSTKISVQSCRFQFDDITGECPPPPGKYKIMVTETIGLGTIPGSSRCNS